MHKTQFFLPPEEFNAIYAKVPRLTVEVIVRTPEGIVLTKRSMEPSKGKWHIPGGTVRFGEPLDDAVRRIAEHELGIQVKVGNILGYIEYPQMMADGYNGWPVGVAFEATIMTGELRGSDQGEEVGCFRSVPDNTISEQEMFLNSEIFNA